MSTQVSTPFTNLQLELLRVYAMHLPDEDLLAIRRMIAKYLLEKARGKATHISKEKGYNQATLEKWLNEES
ncbi:MAG: hypothetical protein HY842_14540 [Bacteroidetes bacterium]|nr:hypothetical protein [Bacteroidota bacterium]